MKWPLPSKAQEDDTRIIERFAWLTTKCVGNYHNGRWTEYMVWLENYTELQKYHIRDWMYISNNIIPGDKVVDNS